MKVGDHDVDLPAVAGVGEVDPHARLHPPLMIVGGARQVAGVTECPPAVPEPEGVRIHVVGNVEIDRSVAVDIGSDHPEGPAGATVDPRRRRHVGEGAVAVVAPQHVRLRLDRQRAAEHPQAGGPVATVRIRLRRPLAIPADIEIEEPVAVGIDEGSARAPPAVVEACRRAPRLERAVAPIVEQDVAAVAGEEQVGEAVAVMVSDGDAMAVAGIPQATPLGDVVEPPAAEIAEAAGAGTHRGLVDGEGNAADEDEIVAAVEIEVDRPEAAAVGRRKRLLRRIAGVMNEIEPRRWRDVGEPGRAGEGLGRLNRRRLPL